MIATLAHPPSYEPRAPRRGMRATAWLPQADSSDEAGSDKDDDALCLCQFLLRHPDGFKLTYVVVIRSSTCTPIRCDCENKLRIYRDENWWWLTYQSIEMRCTSVEYS